MTVTADTYDGIPDQVAGRYFITLTATAETEEGGAIAFVQPAGMTAETFLGSRGGPPTETEAEATSGTASEEMTAEREEMSAHPPFVFESTYAGGTFALPDQSAEVVLDLTPGEWIAWADDPEAPQEPVVFEVTGEMPADLPEPASSAILTMSEMEITVSDGALAAGQQIVKVENIGAQPHFLFIAKGPDDVTEEQLAVALEEEMQAEMTGTPPAYTDYNPDEEATAVAFTATQSTGTALWISLELEPGSYGLRCFFPDIADGMPDADKGMYSIVRVAG